MDTGDFLEPDSPMEEDAPDYEEDVYPGASLAEGSSSGRDEHPMKEEPDPTLASNFRDEHSVNDETDDTPSSHLCNDHLVKDELDHLVKDEPDRTSSSSVKDETRTRLEKVLKERLPDFIDTRRYATDPNPINYLVEYVAHLLLKEDQSQVQKELAEIKFRDDISSDRLKDWIDECRSVAITPKGLAVAAKKMPRRKPIVAASTPRLDVGGSFDSGASSHQDHKHSAGLASSSMSIGAVPKLDISGSLEGGTSSHQNQVHHLERPSAGSASSSISLGDVPLSDVDVVPRRHYHHRSRSPRDKRGRRSFGPMERLSRELVRILRHRAERCNVDMTGEGFAPIHQVLSAAHASQSSSIDDVRQVVRMSLHSDRAPRFEIREGEFPGPWIRATRYHSLHSVSIQPSINERRLSEALCKILRHEMNYPDGFAPLTQVVASLRRIKPTPDDVLALVRKSVHSDGSPRFQAEERRSNGVWIRATPR